MKILGIETSCDETAAGIIEVKKNNIKVLSNVVFSQIEIHKQYGGVVPEVAARNHIIKIIPVIEQSLKKTKTGPDVIAVTSGPGLISSLLIGIETAKALAYAWQKPIVSVNHLAGHVYSNWIGNANIKFPALILIVSGGHTELVLMKSHLNFKIIGQTRDDAAGEAFDKVAKMLELGYPGGPVVSKKAAEFKNKNTGISFPRPMIVDNNFDFSFSGIKTSVLYQIQKDKNYKNKLPEYCHEFQQAVIDVLVHKTVKAAEKFKVKSVLLAGGVAANAELRKQLGEKIKHRLPKVSYCMPDLKYTTDNAAMIAMAGYFMARAKKFTPWQKVRVDCNKKL